MRRYNKFSFIKMLLLFVGSLFFIPLLNAQFTITENFKGSSVASNIILGGNPSATLTSGVVDPINEGWLRLTTDATNQRGFAYINTSFPSTLGVYIEFEYKTWRSRSDSYNGADGFTVFLFDANTTPFRIGAYGGSLGYAQQNSTPGLAGGYLGIGFDEYGNFGMASEGKNGGMSSLQPNSVVLRGPENPKSPLLPYRYLTHKKLGANASQGGVNSIDYNVATTKRPTDAEFYRRVKIYIEPEVEGGVQKYRIRVLWNTELMGAETEHINYVTEDPIPSNLKMGFGSSTGGGFNFHEIRNLLITTVGGVRVQKYVDKSNALPNDILTYTIDVHNESGAAVSNLVVNDVFENDNGDPVNFPDCFEISSITFNNNGKTGSTATGFTSGTPKTTGFTNPFSTTMALEANSKGTFTIVGKVKSTLCGNVLNNSVSLDVSNLVGFVDTDLTNNFSTVSTTILNPSEDLKIEKGVDNNGIAKSTGNTFTIIVTNVSDKVKPAGAEVVVTDVIPTGLTFVSSTNPGWTRTISGNTITFKRSDVLNGLYAYSPITINVKPTGTGPWKNTATVAYTNDANLDNNTSSANLRYVNYWHGTIDTDWAETQNWTANYVPLSGQDIEFATIDNNGAGGDGNGEGAAINDLHLDQDRIIGDLINKSDKDLIVTTENQLIINGEVRSDNTGGIVVNADPNEASGTLLFKKPVFNSDVNATVQFYNKAYECADCGFYRKQWQYFGVPVKSGEFPFADVTGNETVNRWDETYNGDKWRETTGALNAFAGYQITNNVTTLPNDVYNFQGLLNVGNANVALTKTANVNYSGINLVSNSYTAAIPISTDAMTFPSDAEQTVYLFNTGTRDQWRKLNGQAINQDGYKSGQYLAVPLNLGGTLEFPDRIPSTHAFMILTEGGGDLNINYNKLIKNTKVNRGDGTEIVTRSVDNNSASESGALNNNLQLPSLVIDVIGEESADRVWIFQKEGISHNFNNGWDGRKMLEDGIAQLYVNAADDSKLQVATVPEVNSVSLGFIADVDGKYTFEFAQMGQLKGTDIYLHDAVTGTTQQIGNGQPYSFTAKKGTSLGRFRLSSKDYGTFLSADEALLDVTVSIDGKIMVVNNSSKSVSAFVYDSNGAFVQRAEVQANGKAAMNNLAKGLYMIRLQNSEVSDVRRVTVE